VGLHQRPHHVGVAEVLQRQHEGQQVPHVADAQLIGQRRVFAQDGGHLLGVGRLALRNRRIQSGAPGRPAQGLGQRLPALEAPGRRPRQSLQLADGHRWVQAKLADDEMAVRFLRRLEAGQLALVPVVDDCFRRDGLRRPVGDLHRRGVQIGGVGGEGHAVARRNGQQGQQPLDQRQARGQVIRPVDDRHRTPGHQRGQQALHHLEVVADHQHEGREVGLVLARGGCGGKLPAQRRDRAARARRRDDGCRHQVEQQRRPPGKLAEQVGGQRHVMDGGLPAGHVGMGQDEFSGLALEEAERPRGPVRRQQRGQAAAFLPERPLDASRGGDHGLGHTLPCRAMIQMGQHDS